MIFRKDRTPEPTPETGDGYGEAHLLLRALQEAIELRQRLVTATGGPDDLERESARWTLETIALALTAVPEPAGDGRMVQDEYSNELLRALYGADIVQMLEEDLRSRD